MLSSQKHFPTIHHSSHEFLFEPDVHGNTFVLKGSPDVCPPSCVYIGVVKNQKDAPPEGQNWILFWHIGHPDEDNLRVVEVCWNAMDRGIVVTTDKKRNELPPNLVTFCVGHLNTQELDRLDKLSPVVVSRPLSSVWVMEVFRTAIRDGLLEEEAVEKGVMGALAVNW